MIKQPIHQENIKVVNVYASNTVLSKCIKETITLLFKNFTALYSVALPCRASAEEQSEPLVSIYTVAPFLISFSFGHHRHWVEFPVLHSRFSLGNYFLYIVVYIVYLYWVSQVAWWQRSHLQMQEMQAMSVWSLGWEDPGERNWKPTAVFLDWKIP